MSYLPNQESLNSISRALKSIYSSFSGNHHKFVTSQVQDEFVYVEGGSQLENANTSDVTGLRTKQLLNDGSDENIYLSKFSMALPKTNVNINTKSNKSFRRHGTKHRYYTKRSTLDLIDEEFESFTMADDCHLNRGIFYLNGEIFPTILSTDVENMLMRNLTLLLKNTSVRILNIRGVGLTDNFARKFADELRTHANECSLEHIDLSENKISIEGIYSIAKSVSLTFTIKSVFLQNQNPAAVLSSISDGRAFELVREFEKNKTLIQFVGLPLCPSAKLHFEAILAKNCLLLKEKWFLD